MLPCRTVGFNGTVSYAGATQIGVTSKACFTEALVEMEMWFAASILATYSWDGTWIDTLVANTGLIGSTIRVTETFKSSTVSEWVSSSTRWARANSLMVHNSARSPSPTNPRSFAGIVTVVVSTGSSVRTGRIINAFTRGTTTSKKGIAYLALGTGTRIAPKRINTECRPVTWGVTTLIHILTSACSYSLESSLTVANSGMVNSLASTKTTVSVITRVCKKEKLYKYLFVSKRINYSIMNKAPCTNIFCQKVNMLLFKTENDKSL